MSEARPCLTLYVRHGCSLCEDMHREVLGFREELAFDLEVVDIDRDPGLRETYDTQVPVLSYGARVLCNYFLDPVALRFALAPQ